MNKQNKILAIIGGVVVLGAVITLAVFSQGGKLFQGSAGGALTNLSYVLKVTNDSSLKLAYSSISKNISLMHLVIENPTALTMSFNSSSNAAYTSGDHLIQISIPYGSWGLDLGQCKLIKHADGSFTSLEELDLNVVDTDMVSYQPNYSTQPNRTLKFNFTNKALTIPANSKIFVTLQCKVDSLPSVTNGSIQSLFNKMIYNNGTSNGAMTTTDYSSQNILGDFYF